VTYPEFIVGIETFGAMKASRRAGSGLTPGENKIGPFACIEGFQGDAEYGDGKDGDIRGCSRADLDESLVLMD
jgi:hypothetical protein